MHCDGHSEWSTGNIGGMMPQQIFLVTRSRGPHWNDAVAMEQQEKWSEHAAFMDALHAEGFLALVGPVEGTRYALLAVHAQNEDEVHRRLAEDPWSHNGMLQTAEVRLWTLRLGSV